MRSGGRLWGRNGVWRGRGVKRGWRHRVCQRVYVPRLLRRPDGFVQTRQRLLGVAGVRVDLRQGQNS